MLMNWYGVLVIAVVSVVALAALVVKAQHPPSVCDVCQPVFEAMIRRRHWRGHSPNHHLDKIPVAVNDPAANDELDPDVGILSQQVCRRQVLTAEVIRAVTCGLGQPRAGTTWAPPRRSRARGS